MAKYDINEARRVYSEMVERGRQLETLGEGDIDYSLVDMLGFFLWQGVSDEEKTNETKQQVIFACLLAAYVAGRDSLNEKEVATAFFEFVQELDIPSFVENFDELMHWGDDE